LVYGGKNKSKTPWNEEREENIKKGCQRFRKGKTPKMNKKKQKNKVGTKKGTTRTLSGGKAKRGEV